MQETMDFSTALEVLKDGRSVSRLGWNGKGLFITLQVPDLNSKMTRPYVYMTIPANSSQQFEVDGKDHRVPWICSQTDLLANDWFVVE